MKQKELNQYKKEWEDYSQLDNGPHRERLKTDLLKKLGEHPYGYGDQNLEESVLNKMFYEFCQRQQADINRKRINRNWTIGILVTIAIGIVKILYDRYWK